MPSYIIGGKGEKAAAIRGQPSTSTDISREDPHVGTVPKVKIFQLMREVFCMVFVFVGRGNIILLS